MAMANLFAWDSSAGRFVQARHCQSATFLLQLQVLKHLYEVHIEMQKKMKK
jgi:hypothetical protein